MSARAAAGVGRGGGVWSDNIERRWGGVCCTVPARREVVWRGQLQGVTSEAPAASAPKPYVARVRSRGGREPRHRQVKFFEVAARWPFSRRRWRGAGRGIDTRGAVPRALQLRLSAAQPRSRPRMGNLVPTAERPDLRAEPTPTAGSDSDPSLRTFTLPSSSALDRVPPPKNTAAHPPCKLCSSQDEDDQLERALEQAAAQVSRVERSAHGLCCCFCHVSAAPSLCRTVSLPHPTSPEASLATSTVMMPML